MQGFSESSLLISRRGLSILVHDVLQSAAVLQQ